MRTIVRTVALIPAIAKMVITTTEAPPVRLATSPVSSALVATLQINVLPVPLRTTDYSIRKLQPALVLRDFSTMAKVLAPAAIQTVSHAQGLLLLSVSLAQQMIIEY